MSDDAERRDGGSTSPPRGPRMYAFDGTPIDTDVPVVRAAAAPPPSWETIDDGPGQDPDPDDPHAAQAPSSMPPERWLLSIVAVLSSLFIGAVALYFSVQVGVRWRRGDAAGAQDASRLVGIWAVAAIAVGVVGLLVMSGN